MGLRACRSCQKYCKLCCTGSLTLPPVCVSCLLRVTVSLAPPSTTSHNYAQASAWAHWRMAMPALWYSKQTSVYKAKLLAVADLLHPTNWARITTEGALKHHHHSIVDAIHDVIVEAGYNWRDIINCGPPSY